MTEQSIFRRLGDRAARALWSGEVVESSERTEPSARSVVRDRGFGRGQSESGWTRTDTSVPGVAASKASAEPADKRHGQVPEHIWSPAKGRRRTFDPFGLRKLARTGQVQLAINTLLGDLEEVSWSIVPMDEHAEPSPATIEEATASLRDVNPNPTSFNDINGMLARDLLEIGNCAGATNLHVEGRRAEVIPYDAATFTVGWNEHGVLDSFYQYPDEGGGMGGRGSVAIGEQRGTLRVPRADGASRRRRWGDPIEFDTKDVLWGIYNPSLQRGGLYGYPPVELVKRFINIVGGLVNKEVSELEEGMPSGMISLVGEEWSDDNYENFRTYWKNEVQGNQVKHPVAEGEAKFVPFNMTYQELELLDRQRWYSKLVSAAFRVPVTETGLAVGSETTRATSVAQHQRYKKRALGALLSLLEEMWTYQYLHRWFSTDIKVEFESYSDVMERRERAEINRIRLQNGTRSINEIRDEQGLEPVPWGDEPYRPYAGTPRDDEDEGNEDGSEPVGESRIGVEREGDGSASPLQPAETEALQEGVQQNATPTQSGGENPLATKQYDGVEPSVVEGVREWASEPTERMREVAAEQGQPIGEVLLKAELGEESRTESHRRLGISRPTYYKWLRKAGLYEG